MRLHMYTQWYTHARTADIARTPCLASQPEIVDTFRKVRGTLYQRLWGGFIC